VLKKLWFSFCLVLVVQRDEAEAHLVLIPDFLDDRTSNLRLGCTVVVRLDEDARVLVIEVKLVVPPLLVLLVKVELTFWEDGTHECELSGPSGLGSASMALGHHLGADVIKGLIVLVLESLSDQVSASDVGAPLGVVSRLRTLFHLEVGGGISELVDKLASVNSGFDGFHDLLLLRLRLYLFTFGLELEAVSLLSLWCLKAVTLAIIGSFLVLFISTFCLFLFSLFLFFLFFGFLFLVSWSSICFWSERARFGVERWSVNSGERNQGVVCLSVRGLGFSLGRFSSQLLDLPIGSGLFFDKLLMEHFGLTDLSVLLLLFLLQFVEGLFHLVLLILKRLVLLFKLFNPKL